MAIKLSELAKKINCRLQGEDCLIENVADLEHAKKGQLAFVYNPKYLASVKTSNASAVSLRAGFCKSGAIAEPCANC